MDVVLFLANAAFALVCGAIWLADPSRLMAGLAAWINLGGALLNLPGFLDWIAERRRSRP